MPPPDGLMLSKTAVQQKGMKSEAAWTGIPTLTITGYVTAVT